jgi:peptide methionine sulfoxide reductase msrA/msrB
LNIYWHQIDPTDNGGQFADRGSQYQTAIFYNSEFQRQKAEASRSELIRLNIFEQPVVTKILEGSVFYPAEEYHQNYCRRKPEEYRRYERGSGREDFILKIWGNDMNKNNSPHRYAVPPDDQLKKVLSPLQWSVTKENGTESAFENEYWNEKREGLYVDLISGQPLFLSSDKFDSGTGWPSFTRPVEPANIVERSDYSILPKRIEVRSSISDAHLGHLFDDGPAPGHFRYCINSAALRFVSRQDMEREGYGGYLHFFAEQTA